MRVVCDLNRIYSVKAQISQKRKVYMPPLSLVNIRGRNVNMEPSIPASDSNKSEETQQYFYDDIKTKLQIVENYKKRAIWFLILALCFFALIVFISALPLFIYQQLFAQILFWLFSIIFLLGLFFFQKAESGRSVPSENEYIFYRLKNIQTSLSKEKPTEAEKKLKSLIFYVHDLKENYPDKPFTDTIFKNLSEFEEKLRKNLYPSLKLKHPNDEIAKKTEHYLKDVLKLVKEGNLNAICDIDVSGLVREEISLDELYEPTRVERIYGDIKELFSIPKVRYLVTFSIVTLILLLLDFFIARGSNLELVKGDFMIILLASAAIVGGLETYRKTERHT